MSSANMINFVTSKTHCGISFTNNNKSSGRTTEPCGTPIWTRNRLFSKHDFDDWSTVPLISQH